MESDDTVPPGFPVSNEIALGCKRHLVEFINQEDLTYRPIDKAARLAYVGTDVSNINFLVRQSVQRPIVHHFPTNRLNRLFTAYEPDRVPVEAFQLPEKQVVDALLQAYFEKINPGFPVVDKERFMSQYEARDPTNPPSLLLLHSILLVGSHVLLEQAELKPVFFRRAKILIDSRFEANRDVIVQAALLLTWHTDGPEDVAANAWHWIGFAARTAMGLGMHRDAEPSTLVEYNKKMWRRVWWLLVQCDLLIALQFGRPLAIDLEDCDVQLPQASDYSGCGSNTQVEYAIATTELCIIIRSIYRKNFGPLSNKFRRSDVLAEADKRLATWSLMLPQRLQLKPTLTLDLWPATLHLMYNTILILLHRPRPQPLDPPSPSSIPTSNDADICSAAAGVIQSIFESLCDRQHLSSLWVFSVTTLFTAMIQLSIEVRFANPLLAISGVRRYDSTLYSLKSLAEFWPNAESILHFFEHSEKLPRRNECVEPMTSHERTLTSSSSAHFDEQDSQAGARQIISGRMSPKDTIGGYFRQIDRPPEASIQQDVADPDIDIGDAKAWRQLFPFTETFDTGEALGAEFLDYWTEMYWQEPFFGAGFDF
ncbi:hypothetical protein N0V90_003603 [Kalmusia sp. IMI 367209]|nr:hypothetical protein N0V90_003603 [Kalmusia sp. IMI 367209]